jgi:sigma-B regulation protein RsbQ
MLAHGFGCDQRMWRFVLPALSKHYTVVLFDYVGSGNSQLSGYSVDKYSTLEGYASDILDIISAFDYEKIAFCGHSVSSMIGLIAALRQPEKFSELIMVCPSPCFINDPPGYEGGFEKSDLEELINLMDKNYIGWAEYLAPLVMGANSSKELIGELSGSFCSTDPIVAKTFAQATFFSDHRDLLPECAARTLILQSESDSLASVSVGQYINDKIDGSELQIVKAQGHCLHMTNPAITASLMLDFLSR